MNYIYDMVQDLIEKYHTRDPYELCDILGIIYRIDDLGSLKGIFSLLAGEPVIIISKDIDEHMQRQVCAHELGHALLHMDIAKEECLHEFDIYNMRDKVEAAANLFAAHLLIDEEQADSMLQDGYDVFHVAAVLGVSMPLLNLKLLEMSAMGYKFNNEYWGETRPFD